MTESEESSYYPCNDSDNPVCREYVNQGNCHNKQRCRFYHPKRVTMKIRKKAKRAAGFCYCGYSLQCLVSSRTSRTGRRDSDPIFFSVCSRTKKSMKKCL